MKGEAVGESERRRGVQPETVVDLAAPVAHDEVLRSLAPDQVDDVRRMQASLDRRLRDAELIRAFRKEDFSGLLYERFETELARYGISVLRAWMYSGYIFKLLTRRRFSVNPTEAELRELAEDSDAREELATMTVAVTLRKFRRNALHGGGWTAEGGASIATYFIGACLFDFPNEFRKRRVYIQRHTRAVDREKVVLDAEPRGPTDPADIAVGNARVRDDLERLDDERTQAVVAFTLDGYHQDEIVELVDGVRSVRAVEGIMYRWRTKQKSDLRKEGRHDD